MAKNPEERGETKSAPKEIAKLTTNLCRRCGLRAVPPIVVGESCSNAVACAKRQRRVPAS